MLRSWEFTSVLENEILIKWRPSRVHSTYCTRLLAGVWSWYAYSINCKCGHFCCSCKLCQPNNNRYYYARVQSRPLCELPRSLFLLATVSPIPSPASRLLNTELLSWRKMAVTVYGRPGLHDPPVREHACCKDSAKPCTAKKWIP